MIIGLHGKLRSGKDTVYEIIKKYIPEAERRAFADKLKESAGALFDVDPMNFNIWKLDPGFCVAIIEPQGDMIQKITVREFLQRYGTEAHREIFDTNFWVEQCLPSNFLYSKPIIVVTDVRFPNELQHIHKLGGVVVKIERPQNGFSVSTHSSEQSLEGCDAVLCNGGTVEELEALVVDFLQTIGLLKVN